MAKLKIGTCVPPQKYTLKDKIKWLEKTVKNNDIDIFITPQEYFGGDYIMPDERSFTKQDLLPRLEVLSKETNTALVIGLIEKENEKNYERMWFIDNKFLGELTKFMEPNYTKEKHGSYNLTAENNLDNRFKVFNLKGALISGFFCWEIYSDILFAGLGTLDLDLVVNQIKFGVSMAPKNEKGEDGKFRIKKFNHFKDTTWKRKIEYTNEFEIKCPMAISTNSWNLPSKAEHLYGIQDVFTKRKYKVATEQDIQNGIIDIQVLDTEITRGNREHWSGYLERNSKMPPGFLKEYTMMYKVYSNERKLLGKSKDQLLFKKLKEIRYKNKRNNTFKGTKLTKLKSEVIRKKYLQNRLNK